MNTLDDAVRTMRVLNAIFLVSVLLYAWVGEFAGPKSSLEPQQLAVYRIALGILAPMNVLIALGFRRKQVGIAAATLQSLPDDAEAIGQWRSGNLISFVLAETVALLGLMLLFLGGTLKISLPFYVGALLLLIVWFPRKPE